MAVKSIALVVCYIGRLPDYFRYFKDSAIPNSDVDFYIFNDQISEPEVNCNVKMIPLTLEQFNQLASLKLGLNINIVHGYKICDLHPAYGIIFEDYLKSYDFWGHCDIDILFGTIRHFITEDILANFDVITSQETHIAGHFTLYRNNGIALNLFRQTDDYKKVFIDGTTNYHFDESCLRYGEFHPPDDLRRAGQTVSISDIAMDLKQKQQINLYMRDIIREYPDPMHHIYRDGLFTDLSDGQEFMYLNLNYIKNHWRFFIPSMDRLPPKFTVFSEGIIPGLPKEELLPKFRWWIDKAWFSCNYLIRRVRDVGVSTLTTKISRKILGKLSFTR